MVNATLEQELREQLEQLPPSRQRQVLDFARTLATKRPQGVAGASLLAFTGSIPRDDLELMTRAIQEDCEQVDAHDW